MIGLTQAHSHVEARYKRDGLSNGGISAPAAIRDRVGMLGKYYSGIDCSYSEDVIVRSIQLTVIETNFFKSSRSLSSHLR